MGSNPEIMVLQHSLVSPPSNTAAAELSLPLTFFDMPLVNLQQYHRLLMYDYHQPKSHFIEKIIPNLKTSLSLTLKHFLPFAGNLTYPLNDTEGMPALRYVDGDSVSVTFAESKEDFISLKGNHAREGDKFYPLVPQLPPGTIASNSHVSPLLAVQVTLFPNSGGIAIGITMNHVLGDASTTTRFMSAWASINKLGGDAHFLDGSNRESLPFYDRTVIQDPNGLGKLIWNEMIKKGRSSIRSIPLPFTKNINVRATFAMSSHDIQKLKQLLLSQRPTVTHASAYVVTCAYLWICWLKALAGVGEELVTTDEEPRYFVLIADCRGRSDPPIPVNYFGNCLVRLTITCMQAALMGPNGFLAAAESIGEVIHKRLICKKDAIPKDFETWLSERKKAMNISRSPFAISGSPKFDVYDADYGWGKPEKYENVGIENNLISLVKSRKFEGGLEAGVVLPKIKMDAFTTIFNHGLQSVDYILSPL